MMGNFGFLKRRSFGIDLGNNNTLLNDEKSILASQPSYIAFDANDASVKAVGDEAYVMFEKTHQELKSVKPMKRGVIADLDAARTMVREMMHVHSGKSFFESYDNLISGVPFYTSAVERKAMCDVLEQFNARNTYLLFEPLAAAIGMGLNIQEPEGKMIIDIGGGITEIVIISLSGIVAFESINVAGDSFDLAIQDYFRRNYNMSIGIKTAEQVKISIGAVQERLSQVPAPAMVRGKNLVDGLPMVRKTDHIEMAHVLDKSIQSIEQGILRTLETCPPELASDIYGNGLLITGGGANLRGLKERLADKMKLPVYIDTHALTSVGNGLAKVLRDIKKYRNVLLC